MKDKYLPNFVQQIDKLGYEELQKRVITDNEVPTNDALDHQNIMNDLNQDVENDSLVNQDVVNDPIVINDSLVSQDIVHEVRPRTSSRVSHPPVWMKEYVTIMTASMHPHSLANYAS
uniref:Polyprotein n=1 Tax=Solanum tuberosum TaxID=4113 RepID=M1BR11_SOLTU